MPIFTFTSPNGLEYDVEGPEGATQEQAFGILKQRLGMGMPKEESSGLKEIAQRTFGLPAQVGADLVAGTAGFMGGMPAWVAELFRSGELESANKAYDFVSSKVGEKLRVQPTDNPWVQEQAAKVTSGIGKGFEWAGNRIADFMQHVEPSISRDKAEEVGKAGVLLGTPFLPKLIGGVGKSIRGTPEPPLIRLPPGKSEATGPWKPTFERPQQTIQPDLFPDTIKEFLPTVEETVPAPKTPKAPPSLTVQDELFTLPQVAKKPEARIFQESSIVDPRYVPPGFFDRSTYLPPVGTGEATKSYEWKDNTSNALDNLYIRALKTVGGDEKHPLYSGLRQMEADIILKRSEFDPIRDAWIDAYRGLNKSDRLGLDKILFSSNPSKAREFFNAREPGLGDKLIGTLKGATDTRFKELSEVFPELKYNPDYFPRLVKDVPGLVSSLRKKGSKESVSKVIKLQKDYEAGTIDSVAFQKGLNDIVLNKWKPEVNTPTSGHAKERGLPTIPEHLQKYYEHPIRALNEYFNETGQTLVERRFLGKGKPEEAITAKMREAQDLGIFNPTQARSFEELLKVRFSPEARRGPGGGMRAAKDIGYAATIGNPVSAAVQILDVIPAAAKFGVINTIEAAVKSAIPKFLGRERLKTMEPSAVGLKDIAHDINVTVGTVGKGTKGPQKVADMANYALDSLLNIVGFKAADRFGKRTYMTAALNKYAKMAKGKHGDRYLEGKGFKNIYKTKAEWDSFKKALAEKDVSDVRVREAMVMELLDMQPISISSMPIAYIKHPQGRIMYMLKTWALRQLNSIRESALKGRKMEATKLTGALVMSNMAAPMLRDAIKSLWGNKSLEEKDVSDYFVASLLRMLFADKYAQQFTDVEGASGVAKIASKAVKDIPATLAPPHFNMGSMLLQDIGDFLESGSNWKSRRYLPITGPYVADKIKEKQ
jgi:hypothetical protein